MTKFLYAMFPVIVLLLWGGINYYVGLRLWQALSLPAGFKVFYIIIFVLLAISFPLVMVFREKLPADWSGILQNIGGTWMIILLYGALLFLLFDILRGINHLVAFFPEMVTGNYILVKRILLGAGVVAITAVLITGHWKYLHPRTENLEITTSKSLGGDGELKILFFSDLHLGSLISEQQLRNYADMINKQDYDLLLIGGDLMDGDHEVWEKRHFAEILATIQPRYGKYGIMGNHEYYNGADASIRFYEKAGIRLLRDSVASPESNVILVGRDDRTNSGRLPVENLTEGLDKVDNYIIVLDHQPAELGQIRSAGADLLLCGHTHNGQIFPLTVFIHAMWEVAYGHKKIDNMDVYVSSGLGLWGPQFRIGSNSEIVKITVREQK